MILEKHYPQARTNTHDSEALYSWVHEHHDDIYRFMRHLTRHHETAEDLAQQTFVNAFQGLKTFRKESSMRTWLHQIAFREYIAWRRKRRLTLPLEILVGQRDRQLDRVVEEVTLLGALHQIPAAQREAFLLFEVQGLSVDEVAQVTGIKPGTVKSHLHYARKQLRELLGEADQETYHETE